MVAEDIIFLCQTSNVGFELTHLKLYFQVVGAIYLGFIFINLHKNTLMQFNNEHFQHQYSYILYY